MRLFNSDQIAKETRAPHRSVLEWVAAGYFTPRYSSGTQKKTALFDEANLRQIRAFARARAHFAPSHWRELANLACQASTVETVRVFVVAVDSEEGTVLKLVQ